MRKIKDRLWVRLALAGLLAIAWPVAAYATGQVVVGTATCNLSFTESVTTGVLATQNIPIPITQTISYTNGTGAKQVDTIYGKQLTLTASTPVTLDLTNLVDPAGNTVNFARVREFAVQVVTATATYNVNVYKGASNGWTVLPASSGPLTATANGGMISLRDASTTGGGNGYVTGGSSKTVTLDPGSNGPILINVLIVGGSAA